MSPKNIFPIYFPLFRISSIWSTIKIVILHYFIFSKRNERDFRQIESNTHEIWSFYLWCLNVLGNKSNRWEIFNFGSLKYHLLFLYLGIKLESSSCKRAFWKNYTRELNLFGFNRITTTITIPIFICYKFLNRLC